MCLLLALTLSQKNSTNHVSSFSGIAPQIKTLTEIKKKPQTFFLPFATWAGIGDGHCLAFTLFVDAFFAFVVVDSGRSNEEQRWGN